MCSRRAGAFSMLEMLAVLVIIGMIAGLVSVVVTGRMAVAKRRVALTQVAQLATAVQEFHLIYNRYPTNDEGLEVLTQPSDRIPEPLVSPAALKDPWDNPYQYNSPALNGEPFEVVSYGADRQEGGDGADADIFSWDPKDERNGS